jgi:hypothetical protein
MNRLFSAISIALLASVSIAQAEFLQMDLSIFGMD